MLIAISLSIAILFLVIFCWNMRSGQYDDTYTPSVRILFDDKVRKSKPHGSDASVSGTVKSKQDIKP